MVSVQPLLAAKLVTFSLLFVSPSVAVFVWQVNDRFNAGNDTLGEDTGVTSSLCRIFIESVPALTVWLSVGVVLAPATAGTNKRPIAATAATKRLTYFFIL